MSSVFDSRVAHCLKVCQNAMGVSIIYYPHEGGNHATSAIVENRYSAGELGGDTEMQSSLPYIGIDVAAIVALLGREPAEGDKVLVGGSLYRVQELHKDGHGDAKLILHGDV